MPAINADEYTLGSTRPMFFWVELGGSNLLGGPNRTALVNGLGYPTTKFKQLDIWHRSVSLKDTEPTKRATFSLWEC